MAKNGWEAFSDGRECLGGPPGGPAVVGRPSRRADSGREALQEGREVFPQGREVVGRTSQRNGSG